jgi:hypothetical protein
MNESLEKKLSSLELVSEAVELCYRTAYQLGFPAPTEQHLALFVRRCLQDWKEAPVLPTIRHTDGDTKC